MKELSELTQAGYQTWKLDGLFTPGADFVAIAKIFANAKAAIEKDSWDEAAIVNAYQGIQKYHPVGRGMDTGFYHLDPTAIK